MDGAGALRSVMVRGNEMETGTLSLTEVLIPLRPAIGPMRFAGAGHVVADPPQADNPHLPLPLPL
jgi:hypothetical protein